MNTSLMRDWPGISGRILRLVAALCFRSVTQGAACVVFAIVTKKEREFCNQLLTDCEVKCFEHVNKNEKDFEKLWNYAEEEYQKMLPDLKGMLTN